MRRLGTLLVLVLLSSIVGLPAPSLADEAPNGVVFEEEIIEIIDFDHDGVIEVGEPVTFIVRVTVASKLEAPMEDVVMTDRFGGEFGVEILEVKDGTASMQTRGKTEKVFLEWNIGHLKPGKKTMLLLKVYTDENPAGRQEFTEPGEYTLNSGGTLKGVINGQRFSVELPPLGIEAVIGPIIGLYSPSVRSNLVYWVGWVFSYRLIFSVWACDIDGLDDIASVTVTFPDGTTVLELYDEDNYEWGYHPGGDGQYFDVEWVAEPLDRFLGEYIFTVTDYEGNSATATYTLDEWLRPFEFLSPESPRYEDGQPDGWLEFGVGETIVFDWYIEPLNLVTGDPITIETEVVRVGTYDDGVAMPPFWTSGPVSPPVEYTGPDLPPGDYYWFVDATSSKGNSAHGFSGFRVVEAAPLFGWQILYSEGFEGVDDGEIPSDWVEIASEFNADHTFGVASDSGILGNTGLKSYRQAKIGTDLPVGSTPFKQFSVPLASAITGPGTIKMRAAFFYLTLPSVGNNWFVWRLVGDDSDFRLAMEVGTYFLITAGDSQFVVGPASAFEGQWNTIDITYTLGDSTVSTVVNGTIQNTIPISTPFTSATDTSVLTIVTNFGQSQTGAIYIDDLELILVE